MIEQNCPWQLKDCKTAECYMECKRSLSDALISAATETEAIIIDEVGSINSKSIPQFILQRHVRINNLRYVVKTEIQLDE